MQDFEIVKSKIPYRLNIYVEPYLEEDLVSA